MDKALFAKLIEMPLAELVVSDPEALPNFELKAYQRVLSAYLQCDLEGLRNLSSEIGRADQSLVSAELRLATEMRMAVRVHQVNQQILENFRLRVENIAPENPWAGELTFIFARLCEIAGDMTLAQDFYLRAEIRLEKISAPRKALKAQFNAITAESNFRYPNPERFLLKYHGVLSNAERLGDDVVAGLALFNIAREHQWNGALNLALEYAERALIKLAVDYGTLHYYLALAQRCHILAQLGRLREAEVDDCELAQCEFKEIQEARQTIQAILGLQPQVHLQNSEPGWRQIWLRSQMGANAASELSASEQKLISLLSSGPMKKKELLRSLYGDQVVGVGVLNRLCSLEARLSLKYPGLVVHSGGIYSLGSQETLRESRA